MTGEAETSATAGVREIQFQTGQGFADDTVVDAWELRASQRALLNFKKLLGIVRMRELLAGQIEESDTRFKEILSRSQGKFRECRVDVSAKGITSAKLHKGMITTFKECFSGDQKRQDEAAAKVLYPSHPEHYAFPTYPGVIETIGGLPARIRLTPDTNLPDYVAATKDEGFTHQTPFRAELEDGTMIGWLYHQMRDINDRCEIVLRVWWPAAAPEIYFHEHTQHFAVEYRRLLQINAALVD